MGEGVVRRGLTGGVVLEGDQGVKYMGTFISLDLEGPEYWAFIR